MGSGGSSTRKQHDTVRASEPSDDGWPRFMVTRMIGEIAICPVCAGDVETQHGTVDDDEHVYLRCEDCGHVR